MIEVKDNAYLGLPVLTTSEFETVQDFAFGGNCRYTVEQVADMVIARRPLITNVIKFDTIQAQNDFGREDCLSAEESTALQEGIQHGYHFMIGCLTYAFYLRSGQSNLTQFLDSAPRRSIFLPVRKHSQLQRVKQWLGGEARHEYNADDVDLCGNDVYNGCRDSALFFRHSRMLDELADEKLHELLEDKEATTDQEDDTKDPLGSLSDGFNQGSGNCVEMYIQSHEQELLNLLAQPPEA